MKTIIEYTDSEDDQMALKRAIKSTDMACVLFEIQINMKKKMIDQIGAAGILPTASGYTTKARPNPKQLTK